MKRRDLFALLEAKGWHVEREGSRHTVYTNGEKNEPIPRHREINEQLAIAIIRRNNLK